MPVTALHVKTEEHVKQLETVLRVTVDPATQETLVKIVIFLNKFNNYLNYKFKNKIYSFILKTTPALIIHV